MLKFIFLFILLLPLILLLHCQKSIPSPSKTYKFQQNLVNFFQVSKPKNQAPWLGLWEAESKSLKNYIIQTLIPSKTFTPKVRAELKQQALLTQLFLKIHDSQKVTMLAFITGQLPGGSQGNWEWKKEKNYIKIIWSGKTAIGQSLNLNQFLYTENNNRVFFRRFQGKPEQKAQEIVEALEKKYSLPEY